MLNKYKENCDYIRKTFSLPESTSLYELVNRITEEYKNLVELNAVEKMSDEEFVTQAILKKEKKRGRPRKSDSNS